MPEPDVTHLIERAIRDRLVLSLTYRALDGTVATFPIEPLAISKPSPRAPSRRRAS